MVNKDNKDNKTNLIAVVQVVSIRYCNKMRKSIFNRILTAFLVVIIPLYSISLIIYSIGMADLKESFTREIRTRAVYDFKSLESELNHVIGFQRDYINKYNLQILSIGPSSLSKFNKREIILDTKRSLCALKDMSPLVEDAYLFIPSINKIISTNNDYSKLKEDFFLASNDSTADKSIISFLNDTLYLNVQFPIELTTSLKTPYFKIIVELSRNSLEEKLRWISPYKGGVILLDSLNTWQISSHELNSSEKKAIDEIMSKKLTIISDQPLNIKIDKIKYMVIVQQSDLLGIVMVVYIPVNEIVGPLNHLTLWFWIISLGAVLFSTFFSYWIYRILIIPLRDLQRGFSQVEEGDLDISLPSNNSSEFQYLFKAFLRMVNKLDNIIHEVSEQKTRTRYAELKQLQYQINPHFLYNSIFNIHRMSRRYKDEQLIQFTKRLSSYYEFITKSPQEILPLKDEMLHVINYIEIQKIRFGERIRVSIDDIPGGMDDFSVPPLIIQPIVENAYEHGLKNTISRGILNIHMKKSAKVLSIVIEDNGCDLTDSILKDMQARLDELTDLDDYTGLLNVHRRMQLYYGNEYGLTFSRSEMGGLQILMIMKEKEKNAYG